MDRKNLHAGHRKRIRERFLSSDTAMFSEHELLEILLFYALPQVNTNDIAHQLLNKFRNISGLFNADISELTEVTGIGEKSAVFLKLVSELCRSTLKTEHTSEIFSSRDQIQKYFKDFFRKNNSAVCNIVIMSLEMEFLNSICIPTDDIISGNVTTRDIAETLIRNNAYAIAVGINHTNGSPIPVNNDYKIIRIFAELMSPLGIQLVDSTICGGNKTFSVYEKAAYSL